MASVCSCSSDSKVKEFVRDTSHLQCKNICVKLAFDSQITCASVLTCTVYTVFEETVVLVIAVVSSVNDS